MAVETGCRDGLQPADPSDPTETGRAANPPKPMPRQSCHSSSFPPLSSFPRKREPRPQTRQESIGKNRNPRHRHSRESGNLDPKRGRNLSEKTETPAAVIPAKAGIQTPTQQESIGKNRNPRRRHSRAGGNPDPKRGRNLSEKTETPAAVIPAQAGIQTPNAAGIYRKKQKPPPPSFPRKRESRPQTRQESIGNG
ncbi:putative phage associated protein [Neisseria meningitidis]|nr:putative phage associated protein [Neisseria meningitidis]CWO62218.1 putative phage associated protein [Neisseria meningitidis]CWQ51692.1 putative phage associated protein [Neisseria meningitidis]CWS52688.1 putative phage associated protein [Neisseria meningitidis]